MLFDVCLSVAYIGPKSRTERHKQTKIGTEVAHVTRDSDATFKAKAALLTAALAAVVIVGTYWPWEPTVTLRSALCGRGWLGCAKRFVAHHRGRRRAGNIVAAARLQLVLAAVNQCRLG